jgi:hypothetical protein
VIDLDLRVPGAWVKFSRGRVFHHVLTYPESGPLMTTCSKRFESEELRSVQTDIPLMWQDRCRICWRYLRGPLR